jgi:RNA polymerase sigma-70 factor (ECF subfamily)
MDPSRGSPRNWLFTVARNLVIDAIRARKTRPAEVGEVRLGEDWAQSLADTSADPYDRSLDAWELAEVVAVLSPEHRAVLVETYYHGASVAQAAKTLGIPPGTVKSRTYYALRALRLACAERGVTP